MANAEVEATPTEAVPVATPVEIQTAAPVGEVAPVREVKPKKIFTLLPHEFDPSKIIFDEHEKANQIYQIPIRYDYGDEEIHALKFQSPVMIAPRGVTVFTNTDNNKPSVSMQLHAMKPLFADDKFDPATNLKTTIFSSPHPEAKETVDFFKALDTCFISGRRHLVKNRAKITGKKELTELNLQAKSFLPVKKTNDDIPVFRADIAVYDGVVGTNFYAPPTREKPVWTALDFHTIPTVNMQCTVAITVSHGWYGALGFGLKIKTDAVLVYKEGTAFKPVYEANPMRDFRADFVSSAFALPSDMKATVKQLEKPVTLVIDDKKKKKKSAEEEAEEAEEEGGEEETRPKKKSKVAKKKKAESEDEDEE
jgi:hypothetical protein